ncbi:MAG: helix-turn-helix domain-containing protein [Acetobacteraceae bacterium]|nr:helix-turn-helix domain-containing protein [Acetobacteraceae bacterium]
MKTMTLGEAAAFLHMHPEEVRQRAKRGHLPGAKAGRCWVFIDEDLIAWLRGRYAVPRQALRVTPIGKEPLCHSASETRPGGSTSSPRQASAYEEALRPGTGRRPRSFMTASRRKSGDCKSLATDPVTCGTTPSSAG